MDRNKINPVLLTAWSGTFPEALLRLNSHPALLLCMYLPAGCVAAKGKKVKKKKRKEKKASRSGAQPQSPEAKPTRQTAYLPTAAAAWPRQRIPSAGWLKSSFTIVLAAPLFCASFLLCRGHFGAAVRGSGDHQLASCCQVARQRFRTHPPALNVLVGRVFLLVCRTLPYKIAPCIRDVEAS